MTRSADAILDEAVAQARAMRLSDDVVRARADECVRWARAAAPASRWLRWRWPATALALAAAAVVAAIVLPRTPAEPIAAPIVGIGPRVAIVTSPGAVYTVRASTAEATDIVVASGAVTARLYHAGDAVPDRGHGASPYRLRLIAGELEATATGTIYTVVVRPGEPPYAVVHDGQVHVRDRAGDHTIAAGQSYPRTPSSAAIDAAAHQLAQHSLEAPSTSSIPTSPGSTGAPSGGSASTGSGAADGASDGSDASGRAVTGSGAAGSAASSGSDASGSAARGSGASGSAITGADAPGSDASGSAGSSKAAGASGSGSGPRSASGTQVAPPANRTGSVSIPTGPSVPATAEERWRRARQLRGQGHAREALDLLDELAAQSDAVWSPIALAEAMRIHASVLADPHAVVRLAQQFLDRYPAHALVREVTDMMCRAHRALGDAVLPSACAVRGIE